VGATVSGCGRLFIYDLKILMWEQPSPVAAGYGWVGEWELLIMDGQAQRLAPTDLFLD